MKIAFVTCERISALTPVDQQVACHLKELGHQVEAVVWDDPAVDWSNFELVVVRSVWDYHLKIEGFHRWLNKLQLLQIGTFNPVDMLRWNSHKFYLQWFEEMGFNVAPTLFLSATGNETSEELLNETGWKEWVIKPAVSASSYLTYRGNLENLQESCSRIQAMRQNHDLLVQRFMPEITEDGEWSIIFIGGEYSHALLKQSKSGEFRVQKEFGGQSTLLKPPQWMLKIAQDIVAKLDQAPFYARVDGVIVAEQFYLMELELIEPELFLEESERVAFFAQMIHQHSSSRLQFR